MLSLSNTLRPEVVASYLAISLIISKDKFKTIILIIYANILAFIATLFKNYYASPRPYMIEPAIIPLETYAEYG